jgi:hypothetical protein
MHSSEVLISQGEEKQLGTIAYGFIQGWGRSFWEYQVQPYHGGSLCNMFFILPFFLFVGPFVLSLKLAAIFFYVSGLIVLFWLLFRHVSVAAAYVGCLLYIFPPPLFMARSLIFNGSMAESVVWGIVTTALFFEVLANSKRKVLWVALGIVCGFSLWYCYLNVVTLCSVLVVSLLFLPRRFLRNSVAFFCGGVFGFLPWFFINFQSNFMGIDLIRQNMSVLGSRSHWHVLLKDALSFLLHDSVSLFMFDEWSLCCGTFFNYLYGALVGGAALWIIKRIIAGVISKNKKEDALRMCAQESFVVVNGVVFLFVYVLSDMRFGVSGYGILDYRYALILFPSIFILLGMASGLLLKKTQRFLQVSACILVCALCVIGIVGNGKFIYSLSGYNGYLCERGYAGELVGAVLYRHYGRDFTKVCEHINALDGDQLKREAYQGYGVSLWKKEGTPDQLADLIRLYTDCDDSLGGLWYVWGLGWSLFEPWSSHSWTIEDILVEVQSLAIDNQAKRYLLFGFLVKVALYEHLSIEMIASHMYVLGKEYLELAYFLYGIRAGSEMAMNRTYESVNRYNDSIPVLYRESFMMGVGSGISEFFAGNSEKIEMAVEELDPLLCDFVWQGYVFYLYRMNNFTLNEELKKKAIHVCMNPFQAVYRLADYLEGKNGVKRETFF